MKVAFYTLGCKVNSYETESIISDFKENNYEIVDFNSYADIYVINTCTVTNNSDQKSRKIIRQAKNKNENAIIVVMGCYSQIKYEDISKIENISIVIGNKYKNKVVEFVNEYLKNKKPIIKVENIMKEKFENMKVNSFENHTRAFVKIQDGCNNYCSYCIIPFSRGNVRSKPKEDVIKEVTDLTLKGYKEVVLTGIHTGHYGLDLKNNDFSDLLIELEKIENLERIRISSIEITELNDKFLKVLNESKKIVDHMHIPLQSGCDKILSLMNRKYDVKYYIDKINEIRKIRPNIAITTDVIVGFPGETEEDFLDTVKTIKKIKFASIHVFPYSNRSNTVASKMKNQIDGNVKKERVKVLLNLSEILKYEYYSSFIGKNMTVLTEKYEDGYLIGHLSNYGIVKFKGEEKDKNKLIKVTLNDYKNDIFT